MNTRNKFSINFDLHTDKESLKELKNNVGISKSKMYDIIEKHLLKNGFEWAQGSGYITKNAISSRKLTNIITELYDNNVWLGHFTRDIKRTIVDNKTYSYDSMITYYDNKYCKKYYEKSNNESVQDIKNSLKSDIDTNNTINKINSNKKEI